MTGLRVAPIVEGHGEVASLRTLLLRVWTMLDLEGPLEILRPIRHPKSRLTKEDGLTRAVSLAAKKLDAHPGPPMPSLVLVLIDADEQCPAELGPQLAAVAHRAREDHRSACVVANVEYETWFVAAAESLSEYLVLASEDVDDAPEEAGLGKGWVKARFRGPSYSETTDQPRMTAAMDLTLCRRRSPSFDKLCRTLEEAAGAAASD